MTETIWNELRIYSREISVSSNDICIYYMDNSVLNDDELFEACLGQISDFRREKVEHFVPRSSKNQSLGAAILLDYGLQMIGLKEKDMKYGIGENGKPYFDFNCLSVDHGENPSVIPQFCFQNNKKELHFSISHSRDISMVAFSNVEIGCDVELIADFKPGICERFFCEGEKEYVMGKKGTEEPEIVINDIVDNANHSDNFIRQRFYKIWTRKESFLKLTGNGIGRRLNSFDVLSGEGMSGVCFIEPDWVRGYAVCCCVAV